MREALEKVLPPTGESLADKTKDLIGCVDSGMGDLATNPKHLEGTPIILCLCGDFDDPSAISLRARFVHVWRQFSRMFSAGTRRLESFQFHP